MLMHVASGLASNRIIKRAIVVMYELLSSQWKRGCNGSPHPSQNENSDALAEADETLLKHLPSHAPLRGKRLVFFLTVSQAAELIQKCPPSSRKSPSLIGYIVRKKNIETYSIKVGYVEDTDFPEGNLE
ncbi:hypothetical protein NL676_029498 [Syzygium grande]|nr:hypothetical protein NL676_029498 [Syzygium grande]